MFAFRIALLVAAASGVLLVADEPMKPTPKFKLDKAVTFVTEPLDKDGYVDFEAALNERLKGKSTPDTNAVVLLLKALGPKPEGRELRDDFFKALGTDPPPEKGKYLVKYEQFFAAERQGVVGDEFDQLEARLHRRPWKPADSRKHAEYLAESEKPLALIVEASKRKVFYLPRVSRKPDGSRDQLLLCQLPTIYRSYDFGPLFRLRVTRSLGEGKTDEAFADVLALHRLARLIGQSAWLYEAMVCYSLDAHAHQAALAVFEHGKPTAKQALAYQAGLLKLPPLPSVAEKMDLGERILILDAIQFCRQEGFDVLSKGGGKKKQETTEETAQKVDFELILRRCNQRFDDLRDAFSKPQHPARREAVEKCDCDGREASEKARALTELKLQKLLELEPEKLRVALSERICDILLGLLVTDYRRISDRADRTEQDHRNGVIAAALAAHFADKKAYPEKLTDLVPTYLAKVPLDVFSEKELIYQKTDSGYLLYSVGVNGKDDGGTLLTDEPKGDDVGVRMPRK